MGFGFDRIGASRAQRRRERLLFVGGSTIMFLLVVVGALLTVHNQLVQARPEITAESVTNESTLGHVVLIAANTKIQKGTKVTGTYLREVHWPRDQVPEGAARSIAEVENMFATSVIPENQPILRTSLSSSPPTFSIGELLPAGHRAITIQVNATSGIEGWATPGAHVDVFLTYLDQKDGENKTRVVVENAVVLSFGGSVKTPDKESLEGRGMNFAEQSTVTLAVPFSDSLKIQTAISMGRITLALRNANDLHSPGQGVFSASQWDQSQRQQQVERRPVSMSKGYARITDSDGSERQYVLGQDDKWQTDAADDIE